MVDWGAIGRVIVDFIKNHGIPIVMTTALGTLTFGPEGALAGVISPALSSVVSQRWFRWLLTAVSSAFPFLIQWLTNSENAEGRMTMRQFIEIIVEKVRNALRRLGLAPNHSNPSIEYQPRHFNAPPGL